MTQANPTVRVRVKEGSRIITGRNQFGRPNSPKAGEWIDLPARELDNKAIAAQVETEEQAAASDAAAETAASEAANAPDPGFMRGRKVFVAQQERELEAARSVTTEAAEEALEEATAPEADPDNETPVDKGRRKRRS